MAFAKASQTTVILGAQVPNISEKLTRQEVWQAAVITDSLDWLVSRLVGESVGLPPYLHWANSQFLFPLLSS
jgi:hypothetical protein